MNAIVLILAAATVPLRNPFWPVGHRGTPEAIGDEPRVRVVAEQTAAEEAGAAAGAGAAAQDADDALAQERRWIAARKSLRIGGMMTSDAGKGARQSVAINGFVYGDGDLVSVNHDGWRFTWRVKRLTENKTLQLVRVRARELDLKGD